MEYIYATYLLESAERRARTCSTGRKRSATTMKNSRSPSSRSSPRRRWSPATTRASAPSSRARDIILKPLDGMGGAGIFRVRRRRHEPRLDHRDAVRTTAARTIMAQRYIPEIVDGDKRVLLIGGEVVPYLPGAHPAGRRNARQPGRRRPRRGAAADAQRARDRVKRWRPSLRQRGLLLVGLDVIGDYLTEINVTSPTCFQEIEPADRLLRRRACSSTRWNARAGVV